MEPECKQIKMQEVKDLGSILNDSDPFSLIIVGKCSIWAGGMGPSLSSDGPVHL